MEEIKQCLREYTEKGKLILDPSHSECYHCKWLQECPDTVAKKINKEVN